MELKVHKVHLETKVPLVGKDTKDQQANLDHLLV